MHNLVCCWMMMALCSDRMSETADCRRSDKPAAWWFDEAAAASAQPGSVLLAWRGDGRVGCGHGGRAGGPGQRACGPAASRAWPAGGGHQCPWGGAADLLGAG